jgi:hypothetical protein
MKRKQIKDKLKQVDTTAYLLSSKANKKRLEAAIKEINNAIYQEHQLSTPAIDKD